MKDFGRYLDVLMTTTGVGNLDISTAIGVSSPYVTRFKKGDALPNAEQYDMIMKLLRPHIDQEQEDKINALFVKAKTGLELIGSNPLKLTDWEQQHVIRSRDLTIGQKRCLDLIVDQFRVDNGQIMAQQAGLDSSQPQEKTYPKVRAVNRSALRTAEDPAEYNPNPEKEK